MKKFLRILVGGLLSISASGLFYAVYKTWSHLSLGNSIILSIFAIACCLMGTLSVWALSD